MQVSRFQLFADLQLPVKFRLRYVKRVVLQRPTHLQLINLRTQMNVRCSADLIQPSKEGLVLKQWCLILRTNILQVLQFSTSFI